MACAYLFAALALISAPAAIASGNALVIVAWVAQTFLQLVLLPIIIVGQDVQGRKTEATIIDTHTLALVEHNTTQELLTDLQQFLVAVHAAVTSPEPLTES